MKNNKAINPPAIIIIAFNRPDSIKRLLSSIEEANYKFKDIPLIISIDYQDSKKHEEVVDLANNFVWEYGDKEVIEYKENKGLKNHILSCGDLSLKYGSVIILEDDLIVSPNFYNYAKEAANYYKDESKVAGISLYSYEYEELGWFKFYPKNHGSDTYFMQWASSWGQLWTKEQWHEFKLWYNKNPNLEDINIPNQVKNWNKSWKKFYIGYLVETDKYFVYPYYSYTTLKDGEGTHVSNDSRQNFVQLITDSLKTNYTFSSINNDDLKYDVFFQPIDRSVYIEKLGKNVILGFDFFGTKSIKNFKADYICSVKKTNSAIESFSNMFIPYEVNIIENELGGVYHLAKKDKFIEQMSTYYKGSFLYKTRKIYAIKEMIIVVIYRFINKRIKNDE